MTTYSYVAHRGGQKHKTIQKKKKTWPLIIATRLRALPSSEQRENQTAIIMIVAIIFYLFIFSSCDVHVKILYRPINRISVSYIKGHKSDKRHPPQSIYYTHYQLLRNNNTRTPIYYIIYVILAAMAASAYQNGPCFSLLLAH